MFHILKCLPFIKKTKIIVFNDLILKTTITDDTWNNIISGQIMKEYYHNNEQIAYISYRLTGQIGLFFVNKDEYRNLGIGKQILNNVIIDMQYHKIPYVWAITTPNHPFWHNVYKNGFTYSERPHLSVSGSGYKMKI